MLHGKWPVGQALYVGSSPNLPFENFLGNGRNVPDVAC
jgi:hypothetical protein